MTRRFGLAAMTASLLLAGCGGTGEPEATSTNDPHGYVEGAEESAEPQRRLVYTDGDGTVAMLDPVTGKTTTPASVPGATALATDGRFVFAVHDAGATVVDTGVWTVDHGDHKHYYRAEAKTVGDIDAGADITVVSDTAVTVVNSADGVTVLDRPALETGDIVTATKTDAAAALPFAGRLLAVDSDGTAEWRDRDGGNASRLDATCPGARTPAVSNRGAVVACDTGVLVVSETDGEVDAETVRYPDSAPDGPATGFGHRPGTPLLGAVTAAGTALVLDVEKREWTRLDGPPALTATGTGEDGPILVLGRDGTLRSFDRDGEPIASASILDDIGDGDPMPDIQVDTERAYLADPDGHTVHEIDYADDLRVARELDADPRPEHLVETGR